MSTGSLTITNALLADGTITSIRIVGDRVDGVGVPATAGDVIHDADGALVLPALAEPHAHLDKAYLSERVENPTGDLMGAITAMIEHAPSVTGADIAARAERAARAYAANGTTVLRTHVDLTAETELRAVEALLWVRDRLRDLVHIEVVALCGWPVCGPEGLHQRELMDAAVAAGVDAVGGCPHLDPSPEAALEYFLEVAHHAHLPIDLHTDEHLDPARSTLEHLARSIASLGFEQTVTASHCVSLGLLPAAEQQRLAELLAEANVNVVTLPSTNLFLQGREFQQAMPRGLTAVGALRRAGVNVAAGWDNLQDPFNPVGRADCLETAGLVVMAAHLLPDDAYDSVSNAGRRLMGLSPAGVAPGDVADLVLLRAGSVRAAIAEAPSARTVIRAGQLVAPPG